MMIWTGTHQAIMPLIFILVSTGCKSNPNYCPDNPDDNCTEDAGTSCKDNTQCVSSRGVCDTRSMTCVQCTAAEPAACGGASPVCGADDSCHGCSSHAECPDSNVCLPDGSCAATGDVAYVVPDQAGRAC